MNISQMLHQMCHQVLSNADVKAICKSRGFSSQESASRALFENFFLSDIGVEAAIASLTREETVLLHMLVFTGETVDVSFFARVYGEREHRRSTIYDYRTFTRRYKDVFKQVKSSLVRKGVLLIAEDTTAWNADTKMERWRFRFPREFERFLPPLIESPRTLEGGGDSREDVLRRKLVQVTRNKQPSSFARLVDGELRIGDKEFRVEHLLEWQRACWEAAAPSLKKEARLDKRGVTVSPVKATTYILSRLRENEWIRPAQLSLLLGIFCDAQVSGEDACAAGWRCSCLAKQKVDDQTYCRLPIPPGPPRMREEDRGRADATLLDTGSYLHIATDGSVSVNLETIPYQDLEYLARISNMHITDSGAAHLSVVPNLIKMGNVIESIRGQPLVQWLEKNAPAFRQTLETVEQRWGRQIIHENLLIAHVGDLGLKVQLERAFPNPEQVVFLPNDYVAFPPQLLGAVEKVVARSGHVIKAVQREPEK